MEVNRLLVQIIENQKTDGERLARVESLQKELRHEVLAVRSAQAECPARVAELQRQGRRAAWITAAKILAGVVGIVGAIAGAIKAIATMIGG